MNDDNSIPFIKPEKVSDHVKAMTNEELAGHFNEIKETWHKAIEDHALCIARSLVIKDMGL
jgi:hypothetical protein